MNKLDPDTEFYKSSLDACKSTIIQQESEIRKLRETLDIRNKRIVQLESQMGTAAINNASRPTEITTTEVDLSSAPSLLNQLMLKLDRLTIPSSCPTINVYNTCQQHKPLMTDQSLQTASQPSAPIQNGQTQPNSFSSTEADAFEVEEMS